MVLLVFVIFFNLLPDIRVDSKKVSRGWYNFDMETIEEPVAEETPSPEIPEVIAPQRLPFWRRPWLLVFLPVVFFALGIGSGYLVWGHRWNPAIPGGTVKADTNIAAEPTVEITIPEKLTRYEIPLGNAPVWGKEDAPITLVEFSDYQCPYCKQWYDEVLSPLMAEYPDKVRFVYRDFPLASIHDEAVGAAAAARCAGEQDKYWEYHNALFDRTYGLGDDSYEKYAQDLKLDMSAFNKCVTDGRYRQEVTDGIQEASTLGVRSTPTFFLNGIPIEGALPYSFFKQVIDLELAGKLPKE
jgi:protein-disulfide isomerase